MTLIKYSQWNDATCSPAGCIHSAVSNQSLDAPITHNTSRPHSTETRFLAVAAASNSLPT